jgi:hypothetical protein
LKNDGVRQWGWDDIPYNYYGKKQMFESTNQHFFGKSFKIPWFQTTKQKWHLMAVG